MTTTLKPMTVGYGNSIMLLVGDALGLRPSMAAVAKRHLEGGSILPTEAASIERQAVRLNDQLRHDPAKLAEANAEAEKLKAIYGFQDVGAVPARSAGRALEAAYPFGYCSPDNNDSF